MLQLNRHAISMLSTFARLFSLVASLLIASLAVAGAPRPNVVFIAIDDLNDWIGALAGHPQAKTPNIDRLAARSVLFANAHCQAPICQPSRTSLLTGTYPWNNGSYDIAQRFRDSPPLKAAVTIPEHFRNNGYTTVGVGKIFHHDEEEQAWVERGPRRGAWPEFPWKDRERISGLPQGVSWVFDFGPVDDDFEEMPDGRVSKWAVDRISAGLTEPFFIGVGLTGTHLPLLAPRRFHDNLGPEEIILPEVPMDDLEDLPPMGRKFTRYFDASPMSHQEIMRRGLWRDAVTAYLACVSMVDEAVGRVLDAVEQSPYAENTIIVLFSDHGFHLGEKLHWEKRSLWERSTRVPLLFAGGKIAARGTVSHRAVGLVDIYPTLIDLCGLPARGGLDGRSLVPLLRDSGRAWPYPALTMQMPGNLSIRTEEWRYIRYANGDEELYKHPGDRHELRNIAGRPENREVIKILSRWIPATIHEPGPYLPIGRTEFEFDWQNP